ncbi:hypothetical protein FHL15_008580 [Xylaria flabelliformis]|uniref:Uncharacterized protein n=1 Tax=Xylaria flabelliformis TaxID=2512241 RepID=A0A553HRM5_9PEZI|nr:hypothetical protein FHL15_008580 [Xylaria flabelliformis]
MMREEARFLGIPRETRQHIYDYVILSDLNYEAVKLYKDGSSNYGTATVMYRNPIEVLTVPWVNLLLTCKYINTEMGAYMSSPVVLGDEANRTYTMVVCGTGRGFLRSSSWQKIPCSPSNVEHILVNIHIDCGSRLRRIRTIGNGGPTPIVRQLYQTLNLLLHNGPILSRAAPLQQPLKLKNLDVHVTVTSDGIPDTPSPADNGIKWCLKTLKNVGLLQGYVDRVHIHDENGHTDLAIEAVDNAGVPASWDRNGFEWGQNHSQSVKWETFDENDPADSKRRIRLD